VARAIRVAAPMVAAVVVKKLCQFGVWGPAYRTAPAPTRNP
jgi:hypothetical protein